MATIVAFFESAIDTPLTAPANTPTIRIRRTDTQALVVTDLAMTEQGDGNFSFDFSPTDGIEYAARSDGDPTVSGQTIAGARYAHGSLSGTTEARIEVGIPDILVDTAAMQPLVDVAISTRSTLTQADILNDATPFAGANIDVAISTRSSHTPADVDTTITASHGAGNWITASGFAVAGDAMTLTAGERTAIDTELAAAHGAGAWDGTASIADIQAGMTAQGYTTGRAPLLDNLDVAVSTRSSHTAADVDTLITASHGAGNYTTATGFAVAGDAMTLTAGERTAIDTELAAAHGAGAWDGTASIADIQAGMTAQGYTTGRAPLLDNLDVAVSTRSTLTQADILNDATPFAGANIDVAVSTRAVAGDAMTLTAAAVTAIDTELAAAHGAGLWDSATVPIADIQAGMTAQGYTVGRAPLLDNLDVAVSTRSSHTAADAALAVRDQGSTSAAPDGSMGRSALLAAYAGNQGPGIYVDTYYGVDPAIPSIDDFDGSKTKPVASSTVAKTLAAALGVRTYYVVGLITLNSSHQDFDIYGTGKGRGFDNVHVNGQDCYGATFVDIRITGDFAANENAGNVEIIRGSLNSVGNVTGIFRDCGLLGDIEIPTGAYASQRLVMSGCYENSLTGGTPATLHCGGALPTALEIVSDNYRGQLTFADVANVTTVIRAGFDGGSATFDATCTAAITATLYGDKEITIDPASSVTVNEDAGTDTIIGATLAATHGAGLWDGTASIADIQAGMTAQGYTVGRAPLLDNLDDAISTRSSHTPADVDTTITASHGAGNWITATGFAVAGDAMALTAAAVTAIDTELAAAHGAGAWDSATVPIADIQAGMTAQGYTAGRAPLLDNLDVAVSTRSSHTAADVDTLITASHGAGNYTTATGFAVAGDAMTLTAGERTAIDTELAAAHGAGAWDGTATAAVVQAGLDANGYTIARSTLLDNLDAAISGIDAVLTASHGAGSWSVGASLSGAVDEIHAALGLTLGSPANFDSATGITVPTEAIDIAITVVGSTVTLTRQP